MEYVLLAFYRSKNHIIWFRGCYDMAISRLDVISTWVRRLFTVTSQDKFLKLWKNMVNGRKWYLQGGIFFKATGCSLDQLQPCFWFLRMKQQLDHCCLEFHATGPKTDCNWWLVQSSCSPFCSFELDLESLERVGMRAHYYNYCLLASSAGRGQGWEWGHVIVKGRGCDMPSSGRGWQQEYIIVVTKKERVRATAHYHFHVVVRARARAKVMVRTSHCCCQKDEGRSVSSSGREWVQEWWQGHIVIVERKRARAHCH